MLSNYIIVISDLNLYILSNRTGYRLIYHFKAQKKNDNIDQYTLLNAKRNLILTCIYTVHHNKHGDKSDIDLMNSVRYKEESDIYLYINKNLISTYILKKKTLTVSMFRCMINNLCLQ